MEKYNKLITTFFSFIQAFLLLKVFRKMQKVKNKNKKNIIIKVQSKAVFKPKLIIIFIKI